MDTTFWERNFIRQESNFATNVVLTYGSDEPFLEMKYLNNVLIDKILYLYQV